MDAKLQANCDKLLEYREKIKKKLTWSMAPNEEAIMSALMHISAGKEMDVDRYPKCKSILKQHAGIVNEFRGIGESIVMTKMMLADNPEEYVTGAMAVYKKLRSRHKLTASPFMVMAALTIYETGGVEKADENLDKLDNLYTALKADHPWLIWDSDRGYLAMLVCAGLTGQDVIDGIEECYQACKDLTIIDKDAVHSLAQVLVFSNMPVEEKTGLVRSMIEEMKRRDRPISKSYGLAALATTILLDMPMNEILDKICEVDDFLSDKKGFRIDGARIRRLFATLIVFITYIDENSTELVGGIAGTLAMQIVNEIISLIIITSISVSNAVANSNF